MSNFPLVRYKTCDTWIPTEDIDGVDANETVLADITNVDFSNGYIENASNITEIDLPSNITTEIANGYALLSAKTFYHSTQGQQTAHILWKESTSDLKIYRNNDLLNLDEGANGIIYLAKPEKISYNLVNDQLKINLNIRANYITVEPVILNLTLVYSPKAIYILPPITFSLITFVGTGTNSIIVSGTEDNRVAKSYEIRVTTVYDQPNPFSLLCTIGYSVDGVDSGETFNITTAGATLALWTGVQVTFPGTTGYVLNDKWTFFTYAGDALQRLEGWYVTPRWLGWAQKVYAYLYNYRAKGEFLEDFQDTTYIPEINFGGWVRQTSPDDATNYVLRTSTTPRVEPITVTNVRNAGKVSFDLKVGLLIATDAYATATLKTEDGEYLMSKTLAFTELLDYREKLKPFEIESTGFSPINAILSINVYGIDDVQIDNIKITPSETVVIGVYGDGQRGLLFGDALGVYGGTENLRFTINESVIDWRIVRYEVYVQISGVSLLVGEVPVDGTGWSKTGYLLSKDVHIFEEDDSEYHKTLNFKYNLPNDARVDNQRMIYSEISHKGRVYFVNGDYKIYQSHISTNLVIQADAFPYDEETGFGYIIVDHSKVNLALANSPTNDMITLTNQGLYVYFIQPSGNGSFKQLRISSGSVTISSLRTLTSLLNGEPATDGLFWIDYNGIYYYVGGTDAPENLITLTHKRYWESLPDASKEQAIGFYNPSRKEYWLSIDGKFLIFELSFKKFKKYESEMLPMPTDFIGYVGLTPYYIDNSHIISCDPSNRLSAIIDTHYNSVEGEPEIYHKILQELYIEFGASDSGATIYMQVYADDWLVSTYTFNSNEKFSKWLSPVGVRFNRLKLRIIILYGKHVKIKEFGFSYSPDVAEPLGITPINIAESGYGFNYGFNY